MLASTILTLAGLVSLSTAGYVLEDDYTTGDFFSMFNFFTDTDPTNGYVTYVDQSTAQSGGLISTGNGSIYMGVDHTNVASGSGRSSVRLTSKKSYTHGLIILDLAHMPGGVCGTWPAFWTVGPNWPEAGEIDIIEGVNMQLGNSMALHTGSGCSIVNNGLFSGMVATPDCDVNAAGQPTNAGCAILNLNHGSFGHAFNQGQGGVYATEWTSSGINIWFFPRGAIPSDITSGSPDPANWGHPVAGFGSSGCDIDDFFSNHQIVFDTTFCGDWAGDVWSVDPICGAKAPTCQKYVQNNPSAFADAYWSVNSLRVYQGSSSSDSGTGNGTFTASGISQSASATAGGIPGAKSSGVWPPSVVPPLMSSASASAATATASADAGGIPTTGFSRGGNGRPTKTWGWGAKFADTDTVAATATPVPSSSDEPATSIADAGAAVVTVSADGSVSETDTSGSGDNGDDGLIVTEYVTVTALTFEDFPKQKQRKRGASATVLAGVANNEAAVDEPLNSSPDAASFSGSEEGISVDLKARDRDQNANAKAHLTKHKRAAGAAHGHVHRHLFKHGVGGGAFGVNE